ncbi:C39 family peptidase [Methylomonas sp. SURF-2]|uniref:C39 family peptidase n=1 Tax=Methylomonas subterranea TaxID=2952225 RepID=A0ABT1TFB5_9GAMM|nr:C39 family peptidase [Methylomonas sp. SURF-2]MCQ8103757.1 C39 family peptidase [Methylomonas sp. SURF-2]
MKPFIFAIFISFTSAVIAVKADSVYLNGVAGGGNYTIRVTSFAERRFKTIYKQKYDFSCGSATLASLLTFHYDHPVDEQAVFVDMYQNGDKQKIQREGFSLLDMKLYLARQGYIANGYKIDLDNLLKINAPAITIINNNGYLHFVIIKGVSAYEVLVGDPAVGLKRMSRKDFEAMRENRILFLINDKALNADNHFQDANEWALQPKAPIESVVNREHLSAFNLLQPGRWDF